MGTTAVIEVTANQPTITGNEDQAEINAVAIWAMAKRTGRRQSASTDLVATGGMASTRRAAELMRSLQNPETVTGQDLKELGNTAAAYWRDCNTFRLWITSRGGTLATVQPGAIQQWQTELVETYAPSTVARKIAAVSSFFNFAAKPGTVNEGRIRAGLMNPASGEMIDRVKPSSTPASALTVAETVELLAAANASEHHPRDRAIILTLATAGLRVSELCNAHIEDVKYSAGTCVLDLVGKGGKARSVAIAAEVCDLLDFDAVTGPLFLDNNGERLNRHQVERILTRLQRAAGIRTKLTPHVLRATFVTEALEAGTELWAVADAAGHSDTRTTRGYQRRKKSGQAKAAMAAGLVARFTPDD